MMVVRYMKNRFGSLLMFCLAAIITAVSCFGSASFCAELSDAYICEQLGVLIGSGDGVDDVYLAALTTREQAAYITLRLVGKETEAKAYAGVFSFVDSNTIDYADGARMLNYLRAYPEYGWQGNDAGMILPSGFVTAQAIYKVALTVLGYRVGVDFQWEDTITFARELGMSARVNRRLYFTNNDLAAVLVETLKTYIKDKEQTLCERLVELNVINAQKAHELSMIPGSPGYAPLLAYDDGGPLVRDIILNAEKSQLTLKFNVSLNPSYAKSLKNYEYFVYGKGYIPLPISCITSMPDENTIIIQFPEKGWVEGTVAPRDAFQTYISTYGKNEIRISGLLDVEGNVLDVVYIDVPR